MIPKIGRGVYSIPEAAALAEIPPARIRMWFTGRGGKRSIQPLMVPEYERIAERIAISFFDLVDAVVASYCYENGRGVPLRTLRKVYENLSKHMANGRHPFCLRNVRDRLRMDGVTVFLESAVDEDERRKLIDLKNNQHCMPEVLLPFLDKLKFDTHTAMVSRWNIADGIVLDPAINFGKPSVQRCGIPTSLLMQCYEGNNGDECAVARWYQIDPADVRCAVAFERKLLDRRCAA